MNKIKEPKENIKRSLFLKPKWISVLLNKAGLCYLIFLSLPISNLGQTIDPVLPQWNFPYNVQTSLYHHIVDSAQTLLNTRKKLIAGLNTKADWIARQNHIRSVFRDILGPFPQKTPLKPVVTGVIEKEEFKVEKVYFESMPGYYVTGAFFLPINSNKPLPTIIYCSGHDPKAFRSEVYQHVILNYVKKGFAVFAFDPIGQGERKQYFTSGNEFVNGPTKEHSYPGNQHFLLGTSPAYYFIWDGVRAIDYVLTRPEVDPDRIGVTGRSGGGTLTAYLAAFDPRVKAAAPECYITSYEKLLLTLGPQDAEQNFAKSIYHGLDIADLLVMFAPKPLRIISTTRDIFSIQGTRDVYAEVQEAYSAFGREGDFSMVEDDAAHESTKRNRESAYQFFQEYLDNPGSPKDEDLAVFDEKELYVTAQGNVFRAMGGHNLHTLAKAHLETIFNQKKPIADLNDLCKRIRSVNGPELEEGKDGAVFSGRNQRPDYAVEKYLLKSPAGYYLPLFKLLPTKRGKTEDIILLLDERGKQEAIAEGGLADSLAQAGFEVICPDLSGFGELGNGYLEHGDAYLGGIPANLWYAGILVNESLLGIRMRELSTLLNWIKPENRPIKGVAQGTLTADMLHIAVCRLDDFRSLALIDPLISYESLVAIRDYQPKYLLSSVEGGILQYDLYDLVNAFVANAKLLIIDPRLGDGGKAQKGDYPWDTKYGPRLNVVRSKDEGAESQIFDMVKKWAAAP